MRYQYLLVDNDNTLMDFDTAERLALLDTLKALSLPSTREVLDAYHRINHALWEALERGEVTQAQLKLRRFEQLAGHFGWEGAKARALADTYPGHLGCHAELLPGALELLRALHGRMKIALVSNGVSEIQRSRLSRCPFTPLLDAVVISGEIGVSKPDPRMVDAALASLGCTDRRQAVLLGDSLTADIAAARSAGIDSIWFNPSGRPGGGATHSVSTLGEAQALLLA